MKLFVWHENLKNGAYHEDGSAVVMAETLEDAIKLLAEAEDDNWYSTYHWAEPASETEPWKIIDLPSEAQIIGRFVGCDC